MTVVTYDGSTGMALTETIEGCTMPADYTFACVNDFVHGADVQFEDLVYLCLGMAAHIEKLTRDNSALPIPTPRAG